MFRWRRRVEDDRIAAEAGRRSDGDGQAATGQAASRERERQLTGQEAGVQSIEELLFRHDPIGISFDVNLDEYRAEAQTITLRRCEARSVADVRRIAHEEFVRWFDVDIAGPADRYQSIAEEIWAAWSAPDE